MHFDPDEIDFVLQKYWDQMTQDLKNNVNKTTDLDKIVKIVINNRSNEDFLKMLKSYERNLQRDNVLFICQIFLLILNCNLNNIKGAILNEHFKLISTKIVLLSEKNWDLCLILIQCQTCLCKNMKVSVIFMVNYQLI